MPPAAHSNSCPYCEKRIPTKKGVDLHIAQTPRCAKKKRDAFQKMVLEAQGKLKRRRRKKSRSPRRSTPEPEQTSAPASPASAPAPVLQPEPSRPISPPIEEQWLITDDDDPRSLDEGEDNNQADACNAMDMDIPRPEPPTPPPPFDGATCIDQHPDPSAGKAFRWVMNVQAPTSYAIILEEEDVFEIAHWLSNQPLTDGGRDAFLRMTRNQDLPWKNVAEFNKSVDSLPHGPNWYRRTVRVKGDLGEVVLDVWMRNSLDVVRHLIGNPKFQQYMRFSPVREWTSALREARVYGEMWTGDWWWRMQRLLDRPGATVCPIIVASDQTQMTVLSGDKKAWPVYLSIGNISKRIRKRPSQGAMLLVGYIPVDNLACITDETQRRYARWQLFHKCMDMILKPLREVSKEGEEMVCADGGVRRIHPLLAAYMGDFPEQSLVTCVRSNRCPICLVPSDKKGTINEQYPQRSKTQTLDALDDCKHGYSGTADALGIRPVLQPFWKHWHLINISTCVTPDLLHQVDKGVFGQHVVDWCEGLLPEGEIDRRLKGMPRYSGIRHFNKGISVISQWTGNEAKSLAKVFLPVVAGWKNAKLVKAARAILDFRFRAHQPEMTSEDLEELDNDLRAFHEVRDIFEHEKALNTQQMFDGIPKLHMLMHYSDSIRELGTPDGFNTEVSERLHIDCVKKGWRASNKVNATEQMATYLQRREAWAIFCAYMYEAGKLPVSLRRQYESFEAREGSDELGNEGDNSGTANEEGDKADEADEAEEEANGGGREEATGGGDSDGDGWHLGRSPSIAKRATLGKKPFSYLISKQGSQRIIGSTRKFLTTLSPHNDILPLHEDSKVELWTRCRMNQGRLPFMPSLDPHIDRIRALPPRRDPENRMTRTGGFDCVLYLADSTKQGLHRYRAGRIRAIFKLPRNLSYVYDKPLVYVEIFQPFSSKPAESPLLYTTSRTMDANGCCAVVLPLDAIRGTCHLTPQYQHLDEPHEPPRRLSPEDDLLTISEKFYVSRHSSQFMFVVMDYWARQQRRRAPRQ